MAWLKKMVRFRRSSNKESESDAAVSLGNKDRLTARRPHSERASVKTSILASSSFCCASAQKEDCISEKLSYSRPVKKTLKGAVRRESEKPSSDAGLTNVATRKENVIQRNKIVKAENTAPEEKSRRDSRLPTDITASKTRGVPPTQKKTVIVNNLVSPRQKLSEGTAGMGNGTTSDPDMEASGRQKYTDVIRKLRKDPAHYTPNNLMSLNAESNKLCEKVENVNKLQNENTAHDVCLSEQDPEITKTVTEYAVSDAVFRSTDDLDCPCCNTEIEEENIGTSLEKTDSSTKENSPVNENCLPKDLKEKDLEREIEVLRADLERERLNAKNQQLYILELENKLLMMKEDLAKERNIRKETEMKVLKLLEENLTCNEITTTSAKEMSRSAEESDIIKEEEEGTSTVLTGYEEKSSENELFNTTILDTFTEFSKRLTLDDIYDNNSLKVKGPVCSELLNNSGCSQERVSKTETSVMSEFCKITRLNPSPTEKSNCVSHIPAFSTPRTSPNRKRTNSNIAVSNQLKPRYLCTNTKTDIFSEAKIASSRITLPASTKYKTTLAGDPSPMFNTPRGCVKASNVKRKRLTNFVTEIDKNLKDSKICSDPQRGQQDNEIKTQPILCSDRICKALSKDLSALPGATMSGLTLAQTQNVWSCSLGNTNSNEISEIPKKPSKWKCDNHFNDGNSHLDPEVHKDLEKNGKSNSSSVREVECSLSNENTQRTRDEGYSTMSSEQQQQDSAADVSVSGEEEPSGAHPLLGSKFANDDSVTDCSMTSSSDSGFGPLQQLAVPSKIRLLHDNRDLNASFSNDALRSQRFDRNTIISTVSTYLKDYSDKSQLTAISEQSSGESCHLINNVYGVRKNPYFASVIPSESSTQHCSTICFADDNAQSEAFSVTSDPHKTHNVCSASGSFKSQNHSCCTNRGLISFKPSDSKNCEMKEEKLFSDSTQFYSKITNIKTAEKATLTEPEEVLWRENALAHFIDESIWSLYSSESDTQFKFISSNTVKDLSPLESIVALANSNISNSQTIIPTSESIAFVLENNRDLELSIAEELKTTRASGIAAEDIGLLNNIHWSHSRLHSLERVASDSLLYQKDAVHELEDSMKPCLKASRNFNDKNIPLFLHFSASDIYSTESSVEATGNTCPEILLTLEKTMLQNNYMSPSSVNPSHTSSVCSLESSNSCRAVSDETDDVDVMHHPSRKGSEDPDLTSASDDEYENLEHKDFVERWIEREIAQRENLSEQVENAKCQQKSPSVKQKTFSCLKKQYDSDQNAFFGNSSMGVTDKKVTALSCRQREKNKQFRPNSPQPNLTFSCTNDINSSASSLVYPIIFTCENIDDDSEASSNNNDIELDLQLLDSEVKEFNDDFYHLCDIGSSLSIDHTLPTILENTDNSGKSPARKCPANKYKFSGKEEERFSELLKKPKITEKGATTTTKSVRPVTLSFCDVLNPISFHHFQKKDLEERFSSQGSHLMKSLKPTDKTEKCNKESRPKDNLKNSALNERLYSPRKTKPTTLKEEKNTQLTTSVANSKPQCCPKNDNVPNFECSYKLKQSLPVNQNLDHSLLKVEKSHIKKQTKFSAETETCESYVVSKNKDIASNDCSLNVLCSNSPTKQDSVTLRGSNQNQKSCFTLADSKEGYGTAWIHLQTDANLSDPKARASLLESMAETISSSGSSSEEDEEEFDLPIIQSNTYLHKICKEKRKRIKASRVGNFMAMSRRHRSTVINRHSLYYRFGEQEKEAIACFDFLEDIPTSSSEPGSSELSNRRLVPPSNLETFNKNFSKKERVNLMSPFVSEESTFDFSQPQSSNFSSRLRAPVLWNKPISHNMSSSTLNSQDYEVLDHVSLSDSCAESYTSSPDSFDDICS